MRSTVPCPRALVLGLVLLGGPGGLACSSSSEGGEETAIEAPGVAEGETATVETTLGPVTAKVSVTPKEPLIGDIMALTLVVEAKEGVAIEMPVFQEAFTRFSIEGYSDEREAIAGGERHTQSYRMQAASSGRLRIPPLRVVFRDGREADDAEAEERELLTDEISIKVRPVLAGEDATNMELSPVRRPLEEHLGPSLWQRYWWAFVGGPAILALLLALLLLRRGRRGAQISPYERASVALAQLEAEGLPDAETRDNWYVQLSGIVRRYLEDRFALRAPELTTEEFLRVAQRSAQLRDAHKALLTTFLADCDKVKFAGYEPGAEESREVLEAARRFLLETRPSVESAASPSPSATKVLSDARKDAPEDAPQDDDEEDAA